jgi:hypothetical protein
MSTAAPVSSKETQEAMEANEKLSAAAMLETGAYAGLCVYGLSMGSITMTQYFLGLNMQVMAVYGFTAGLGAGVIGAAAVWKFIKLFDIRAEDVFQASLKKLQKSTRVNKTLGSSKPGLLYSNISGGEGKAYNVQFGTLELQSPTLDNWSPVKFVYPRLQMIYQVEGPNYDGMAVVEAKKAWGYTQLELVALDVLKKGEEQVILVLGEEERLQDGSTDALRSFLDYKEKKLHD